MTTPQKGREEHPLARLVRALARAAEAEDARAARQVAVEDRKKR